MLNRPWWIRLLSEDGSGGNASGSIVDGEPPESAGDGGDGAGDNASGDDATSQDATGQDASGESKAGEGDGAQDGLSLDVEAKKVLDEDPFADLELGDDQAKPADDDDLSDLLDEAEGLAPNAAPNAAPPGDTKADEKKPDDSPKPDADPYADLDAFSFVEKVPKLAAKDFTDVEKLLDGDMESQALTPEGFGAWAKKVTNAVRGLVTRAEMTDAMLTRDVAKAKEAGKKQAEETLDTTIDRAALAIAGEKRIGKVGSMTMAQKAARQALLHKADEIVQRQKAKGVDIKSIPLERVLKAAAIDLYTDRYTSRKASTKAPATSAATPTPAPTPAKAPAKPLMAANGKGAAPASNTQNPPADRPAPRPRTVADAEDAILGIKRR